MVEVAQDKKSPIDEGSNHKSSSKAVDADIDPTCPVRAPTSYVEGTVLDLKVDWADKDVCSAEERTLLTITKTFPVTTSPAMEVTWQSSSGEIQTGVLKFFDRRVSQKVRRGCRSPAYGPGIEACLQKFLQSSQAPRFSQPGIIQCINGLIDKRDAVPLNVPTHTADTWQEAARTEVRMQIDMLQQWQNEIRVYDQLKSLQGTCVPVFYGSTSFHIDVPAGADPNFFQIGGILIQRINGPSFRDVLDGKASPLDLDWHLVCKRASDAIAKINALGIAHGSNHFRNVVVESSTMQANIIDFARSMSVKNFGDDEARFRNYMRDGKEARSYSMAWLPRTLTRCSCMDPKTV
ncbi:hypothetical protein OC861_006918 [Tilletia horrida]|nr:hypothetical protein OC861_006918 [Tilletia horrida]